MVYSMYLSENWYLSNIEISRTHNLVLQFIKSIVVHYYYPEFYFKSKITLNHSILLLNDINTKYLFKYLALRQTQCRGCYTFVDTHVRIYPCVYFQILWNHLILWARNVMVSRGSACSLTLKFVDFKLYAI